MTSLEESDEEYLDDPIQLDFRKITETVTNHNQETSQTIFEQTDPEGDLYIEKNNVFQKTIPYKKVSITLPVSFFDLPQNVQLLNSCKQLCIKVVNCEKYPWYHKQFLSSNYSDNDEEVDFYTKKTFKDMEIQNDTMIEGDKKIKIRPVSSPYENLKKDNPRNKPKRKETQLKQSVVAVSNPEINFKKNQGLIGMKITQTPNKSLKIAVQKNDITMSDKTMETEKIVKDKAIVQEKKEKISKNVKTAKSKEDASTPTTSATNVIKDTDDINKLIQNDVIGIEKIKEMTDISITKVDSHDKKMQDNNKVHSTENLNIATETNVQKAIDKIGNAEPKVKKTNINISEKDDIVDLKNNINDKKIQNKTKEKINNKFKTGNIAKIQEVKEKVCKLSTTSKSKVPEIKDKTNQNNVQIIGNKTSSTSNSQKGKTDSNNANGSAKLNIANIKHDDDSTSSVNYKNTAIDQLVLCSGGQLEEQLCLETNKEKHNPDTTYLAKLQGLKLTVTKKDSANNVNNIARNSKIQKDTNRAKNTETKRKVQKKTNSDSVKSIGNDSSSSLGSQNNSMLNTLLINKPVKNKPKKCNADSKLMKPRKKIRIPGNSDINQAQPRLSNEIMKNDDSHIIKCNNPQNSNEYNYSQSNLGVDKLSTPAPVVGKSQSSSFYVHEYKKLMQSSSQHNPKQVDFKDSNQQVNVPLICKTAEENTRTEDHQSKPKIKSLQDLGHIRQIPLTSVNLRNYDLPENVADKNHSNVSAEQNLTNDMKPNPASVILNPSAPTSIQNINQNQNCFATGQSSPGISQYTHVVQNQSHQIPLNIPAGKRCPRILKICKRNPTVANMKSNKDSNPAAGLHLNAFDCTSRRNDDSQRNANNYRIQDRPIQTLVTTKDNTPKQKPLDLQQNQINSQILSNLYSAATHNSFIPNQNAQQQLSIAHQTKQPIVSPNIQTGSHLQAAGLQYKTSHEIIPPTCDIALVKMMMPVNDVQKLQHQNMPNIVCQPQQQRHNISHTILRNESHLGRDRLQMQPNMKNASCQNPRNVKILVQEKPKAAMRQNLYTVTPRQEINQNSVPFNYGFVHHPKISPYGQGFQQAYSEFSGVSPQNYIHCAPIYNDSPNLMNSRNQMQNYWGTYNPSIPPPPPPPPPPQLHIHARGQVINQTHGPYQEYNNPSTTKSVAGTTIIGHDELGPVRKININVEPLSKQNNTVLRPSVLRAGPYAPESSEGTDNKGVLGHSPVAYSKKEMLEELTKITTIESSFLSPVKDLKRPLPTSNTIQEIPKVKKYKPGPLSRKIKESTTAPQTNTSVAPVTHKGYSPPILPIPTYQKTLEILARSDPRLSHSITVDDRITESLKAMRSKINNKTEIVHNENCSFDENQDKSGKKISLDEYNKRTTEDKNSNANDMLMCNIKMEIKCENPEQDLGYDSDSTTKV